MEYFIFEYISFSTGPAGNSYEYMRFSVCLWLSQVNWWGMAKWTSSPRWVVRIYIIQSFIYREVHYFTEPSEGTVWFLYDMEVNQFLSYNRSLTHIFYAYLLWCNGSFSFIFYVNCPRKSVCRQRHVVYASFFFNFFRQVCSIKFFTFWFEWHSYNKVIEGNNKLNSISLLSEI